MVTQIITHSVEVIDSEWTLINNTVYGGNNYIYDKNTQRLYVFGKYVDPNQPNFIGYNIDGSLYVYDLINKVCTKYAPPFSDYNGIADILNNKLYCLDTYGGGTFKVIDLNTFTYTTIIPPTPLPKNRTNNVGGFFNNNFFTMYGRNISGSSPNFTGGIYRYDPFDGPTGKWSTILSDSTCYSGTICGIFPQAFYPYKNYLYFGAGQDRTIDTFPTKYIPLYRMDTNFNINIYDNDTTQTVTKYNMLIGHNNNLFLVNSFTHLYNKNYIYIGYGSLLIFPGRYIGEDGDFCSLINYDNKYTIVRMYFNPPPNARRKSKLFTYTS